MGFPWRDAIDSDSTLSQGARYPIVKVKACVMTAIGAEEGVACDITFIHSTVNMWLPVIVESHA